VDDYSAQFMALSCRDPLLTEHQQIQLYITDLGNPLRSDVVLKKPATHGDAVIFARAYDQRNVSQEVAPLQHQRQHARAMAKTQPTTMAPVNGAH
jgi:hypothetical protein